MPTPIGAIFLLIGIYCFLLKAEYLLGLLIIAGVFEGASAINIGERGIQPYYLVAILIIARSLINYSFGVRSNKPIKGKIWLSVFGAACVISAFLFPFIFAGIPVYAPKVGIDAGLFVRPPLQFGINNIAQAGFLLCHVATAFSVSSLNFSTRATRKAFLFAFYIELAFLCAESICQIIGVNFPLKLILSNPGHAVWENSAQVFGTRNPGTFTEPSFVGAFLIIYCVGFLVTYLSGDGKLLKLIMSILASGLVASSSSIATLCIFLLILLLRYSPFQFPWYIKVRQSKKVLSLVLLLILPLIGVIAVLTNYRELLIAFTLSKGDSSSFVNRTTSDIYGLHLLLKTYGIGVGLGSSRSSSLVTTLLSNIGIAGTFSFLFFYWKLFTNLPEKDVWLKWAAFALLFNMCLGLPDVTMPLLWIPILIAIHVQKSAGFSRNNSIGIKSALL